MSKKSLFDLTGRKIIVTGASQGIGRAFAQALYDHGAEVCIIGMHENVFDVANEIGEGSGKVHGVMGDVGDRENREKLFERCLETLGGDVDVLVNNAGTNIRNTGALEYSYEDWDRMFAVNVEGVFYFCQLAAKHMLKKGYGKIINVASVAGKRASKGAAVYCATKAAVVLMSEALSNEWSAQGIRVNTICPGFTETSLAQHSIKNPERMKHVNSAIPMGRIAQPEDMAGSVVFLASSASDYVTGAHIIVDGGASSYGI